MAGNTKYWFNGLPLDGLNGSIAGPTKYWFNGLPYDTLAAATSSGITAVVNVTQANDTVSAVGTIRVTAAANLNQSDNTLVATASKGTPTPIVPPQVFIDIRTAVHSFTERKRMF